MLDDCTKVELVFVTSKSWMLSNNLKLDDKTLLLVLHDKCCPRLPLEAVAVADTLASPMDGTLGQFVNSP